MHHPTKACAFLLLLGSNPLFASPWHTTSPRCQDATAEQETETDQVALRAEVQELASALAEHRNLELGELSVDILSPDEFRAALLKQVEELHPPDHFDTTPRVYRMLGILPEEFDADLRELVVDGLTASIYGLYSPTAKRILIPQEFLDDASENAAQRTELLAHEVQHGLQDQRWGLANLVGRGADSHDSRLAANALMEGDAVATAFDWILSQTDMSLSAWDGDLGATVTEGIELNSVLSGARNGAFLDSSLHVYSYGQGAAFVQRLVQEGGWERVEAAFDDPPASSEQVLHPEKYFGVRDYPVRLPIAILPALEEAGWRVQASDVVGELNLQLLFENVLEEGPAAKASLGWDGDRYLLLGKGDEHALIWASQWDSNSDARGAGKALVEALGLEASEDRKGRSSALDRGTGPTHLQVTKNRVAIAVGIPEASREEVFDSVFDLECIYDPRDESRGRSDSKVTRQLEREALARIEAESVVIADEVLRVRDIDLSIPLPSAEWTLGDRSQFPILKALVIRITPTVNFNVTSAATQGLTREQTIESNLEFLPQVFGEFELLSQTTHEDERGPGFDLRFSGVMGGQTAHLWQKAFLRGDEYIVLTATHVGGKIEGELEVDFGIMMEGASFAD